MKDCKKVDYCKSGVEELWGIHLTFKLVAAPKVTAPDGKLYLTQVYLFGAVFNVIQSSLETYLTKLASPCLKGIRACLTAVGG